MNEAPAAARANTRVLPRAGNLAWVLFSVLALAGLGVSSYLTYVHYAEANILCTGLGHSCAVVNQSKYAQMMGIPIALLGAGMYLTLFGVGILNLSASGRAAFWLPLSAFGLALAGVGYSAYLTYLELFVIDAICMWCVISAIILTLMLAVATAQVLRES